ncbi:MAG: di-trans,poly-cis-decaprenylcistransferase [Candidatus Levybacteria bacterium RIFCSPLOWO2_01_FULL_39_24]|nr:MAG: di-trans,poly-cis-decaprenylcistransferase [Candidatus Levybacteria bacterium RIFCSPHIGHO2_01_FULL_40_16]OGH28579.1 MAG: di-trans,poly-cis-decaprenylcistransferase [Candidatus Levybacteria bacterium RIFCSPHIGHO2_12_FULL_39_9]OGH45969.1 MAG: di-trans,poly-cis-decaprenylcistransferase [Candidatus Levybacteria bacterium RIFCSPLOWO2_01_FULL_39_24]
MAVSTIPNHVAIIPDGNRRWAKEHGLPSFEGHRKGFDVAVKIGKKIRSLGVHTMTMWAFSTENWNRSKEEVAYLMKMYETFIERNLKQALKEKIRIIHLGRKDRISKKLLEKIQDSEEKTKNFKNYILNIALDYGGQDEVIRGIKKISRQNINNLTIEQFNNYLDTANQPYPNPDLIIRTSGEQRTSGLMIWQAAYAEYIFLQKHFPDVNDKDIENAIEEYSRRQRRFGK